MKVKISSEYPKGFKEFNILSVCTELKLIYAKNVHSNTNSLLLLRMTELSSFEPIRKITERPAKYVGKKLEELELTRK
jgi:hypothetical protein